MPPRHDPLLRSRSPGAAPIDRDPFRRRHRRRPPDRRLGRSCVRPYVPHHSAGTREIARRTLPASAQPQPLDRQLATRVRVPCARPRRAGRPAKAAGPAGRRCCAPTRRRWANYFRFRSSDHPSGCGGTHRPTRHSNEQRARTSPRSCVAGNLPARASFCSTCASFAGAFSFFFLLAHCWSRTGRPCSGRRSHSRRDHDLPFPCGASPFTSSAGVGGRASA